MEERLDSKIYRDGPNGCWLWQGTMVPTGYGQFAPTKTTRTPAHRAVWKWLVGPIPDGLELDHLCRNKRCVNPEHLEPVTRLENIRRSVPYRDHLRPTHCKWGHERTPENLYTTTQGGKACRECARIRNRDQMRRIRQAASDTSMNPR